MKIPKIITKNNRKYIFIKEYDNYVLYKELEAGYKECFNKSDLGLLKEMVEPPKRDLNLRRHNW